MPEFFWIFSSDAVILPSSFFPLTSYLRSFKSLCARRLGNAVMRSLDAAGKSCHVSSNKFRGSQKSLGKPNPRFQWVIFRERLGISMLPWRHVFGKNSCQKSLKNHRQKWLKMKKSYSQVNVWSTRGGTRNRGPSSSVVFDFAASSGATHPRF